MRLSFNIFENVKGNIKIFRATHLTMVSRCIYNYSDMTDEDQNANATLHQDISRVEDLFQSDQARAQDIVDAYSALSQHCQSVDLGIMVLEKTKAT